MAKIRGGFGGGSSMSDTEFYYTTTLDSTMQITVTKPTDEWYIVCNTRNSSYTSNWTFKINNVSYTSWLSDLIELGKPASNRSCYVCKITNKPLSAGDVIDVNAYDKTNWAIGVILTNQ